MHLPAFVIATCALLCASGSALSQSAAASASAPASALASTSTPAAEKNVTVSSKHVIEDDNVRIEETRLRGQAQRISVKNKRRGNDYEIIVDPAGKDPSHDRGAAGRSAWSLFAF